MMALAGLCLGLALDGGERAVIAVHCDPRVELLVIVFRLAGAGEYHMDSAESRYSRDVDHWFAPFRDHEAIRIARQERAAHGVGFDAIPSLAVHLDDSSRLELRMPREPHPEKLDLRVTAASLAAFLPARRRFAEDTRFAEFYAQHQSLYDTAAARVQAAVAEARLDAWVREFFGPSASAASFTLIPGLLCGGGNYGSSVLFADGRLELTPVMGISSWDQDGLPLFGADHIPTVAHELTHSFANPVIDHNADDLEEAGTALFNTVAKQMQSQAYAGWRTMLYESLVRACVVRYVERTQGTLKARAQAHEEEARGFRWTGRLADLLESYEKDRTKYRDLDAFAPHLILFFATEAEHVASAPAEKILRDH
ncbi:MAG: DUF4932 domain-containing protein [Planctomycetota bacterium]